MPAATTYRTQIAAAQCHGAARLTLATGLDEFPRDIFALADTLEVLDLSGNKLSHLPDDLPRLHKLRILFCSSNDFTELPAVLGACPQLQMIGFKSNRIRHVPATALPAKLRWLILTDNALEELPAEIGRCTALQKLMLAGNQLTALPPALADCHRLELIRIAANRLTTFPEHLLSLPRLAWLAYAGNPFCSQREVAALAAAPADTVPWPDLELTERLGEGASGTIYRARRRTVQSHPSDTPDADLAVKLFKGAVTSDGLPHSEMSACLAAGEHPNRIPAFARIAGHPEGTAGLLMPLIDPVYRSLADPPSLASCTRDIYPAGARYPLANALRIAHGIASLATHLHARGIIHGDLYAHNILHTDEGHALLGDFGAASFSPDCRSTADRLQRIEVRAFGCLLEELLDRADLHPPQDALLPRLRGLAADCQQAHVDARPAFAHIASRLADALAAAGPMHAVRLPFDRHADRGATL